jgi:general secretion pathway protein A
LYQQYFELSEAPFSITPDPAFVYLSPRHRDALAHLLYGVGQGGAGGFVQLTGEVGTGKTTLCRCMLEQIPEGTRIALILNPLMTPIELLQAICEELGVDIEGVAESGKQVIDRLNQYLLEAHTAGWRVVIVIDEAQNLSPEALEQVRLLTNLETSKHKLLQIVLLGQPELRDLLQRRSLRQLAQRITARYHLTPLGPEDTAAYVQHRMLIAGARRNPFRRSAMRALYQRSNGVPRLINIIADRALVGAFASERVDISAALVHAAANEVQLGEPGTRRRRWPWVAGGMAAALAVSLLVFAWPWVSSEPPPQPRADIVSAAKPELISEIEPEPVIENAVRLPKDEPVTLAEENLEIAAQKTPAEQPEPIVALLDAEWLEQQNRVAWTGLAGAWGNPEDADAIQASCDGQRGLGFACLELEGSLSRIRQLGLPVLLRLPTAVPAYLLLTGLERDRLLVGTADDSVTATREAVEQHWLGAYVVVWPQAGSWPVQVRRGDRGEAVDIVIQLAAKVEDGWSGGGVFDTAFESWLRQFQVRHGLDGDGIVGPKTLLYLMAPSIEHPRLLESWSADR